MRRLLQIATVQDILIFKSIFEQRNSIFLFNIFISMKNLSKQLSSNKIHVFLFKFTRNIEKWISKPIDFFTVFLGLGSNKCRPLISAAPLGIHIEISASL